MADFIPASPPTYASTARLPRSRDLLDQRWDDGDGKEMLDRTVDSADTESPGYEHRHWERSASLRSPPQSLDVRKPLQRSMSTLRRGGKQGNKKTTRQAVRGLVSKNKIRYQEGGYDLDLTYITPRVIAMGFPSSGTEGYYRNPIDEVERFFAQKHSGHFKIYNLCSERAYDIPARFGGHHARYPFDDHTPPTPISLIPAFVSDATEWLYAHPDNIIAVHCKAGKGRTGVMTCALLLYEAVKEHRMLTASKALSLFGLKRTYDGKGVTIPSQIRYLTYWETILSVYGGHLPPPRHVRLDKLYIHSTIRVSGIPDVYFTVFQGPEEAGGSRRDIFDSRRHFPLKLTQKENGFEFDLAAQSHAGCNVVCTGDVLFRVKSRGRVLSDDNLFHFWINVDVETATDGSIRLKKSELDKAAKDKQHETYRSDLSVELFFSPYHKSGVSPLMVSSRKNLTVSPVSTALSPPASPAVPPGLDPRSPRVVADRRNSTYYSAPIPMPSGGVSGRFIITAMKAHNLAIQDAFGLSDPYAIIRCEGNEDRVTEVVPQCLNPVWARMPSPLRIEGVMPVIKVELWDEDKPPLVDDFLGLCEIPLADILPPLSSWKGESSVSTDERLWTHGIRLAPRPGNEDDRALMERSHGTLGTLHIKGVFQLSSAARRQARYASLALVVLAACLAYLSTPRRMYRKRSKLVLHNSASLYDDLEPLGKLVVSSESEGWSDDSPQSLRHAGSSYPSVTPPISPRAALKSSTAPRRQRAGGRRVSLVFGNGPRLGYHGPLQTKSFTTGEWKFRMFLIEDMELVWYDERVRLSLRTCPVQPVGKDMLKVREHELRALSTEERDRWLDVMCEAAAGKVPPQDDDVQLLEVLRMKDAVDSAILEEDYFRAMLDSEAAWEYAMILHSCFSGSLESAHRECAVLASTTRRLVADIKRLQTERRRLRLSDQDGEGSPVSEPRSPRTEVSDPATPLSPLNTPRCRPAAPPRSPRDLGEQVAREGILYAEEQCRGVLVTLYAAGYARARTLYLSLFPLVLAAGAVVRAVALSLITIGKDGVELAKWEAEREMKLSELGGIGLPRSQAERTFLTRFSRMACTASCTLEKAAHWRTFSRYFSMWRRYHNSKHEARLDGILSLTGSHRLLSSASTPPTHPRLTSPLSLVPQVSINPGGPPPASLLPSRRGRGSVEDTLQSVGQDGDLMKSPAEDAILSPGLAVTPPKASTTRFPPERKWCCCQSGPSSPSGMRKPALSRCPACWLLRPPPL